MSKVVNFTQSDDRLKAVEARKVLEQAYAYYGAEEEVSASAAIEAVEAPIEQMYAYYPAA
ncbi:hypothetical protein [Paenirhodobacter populi]|uniref:Uncharacterized protein n=1 Tax=Paenirhodobacter populi TaxID=2306993 RepID=A0A443KHR1_9RHOB|nr:hypothetical protein [Sinirhodobacter populi]RWR07965.1 hypothetical protein D2T32_10145 [Sinirhodobacter populi]RWR08874.1 hypothetical protein D2T33_15045 [Sinirhodobacter populi]RWR23677.1 hypothetical protein D2T30_04330 [Sinirhodobacter populi]RWR30322.1 hypothetical protein D2T31_07835 [Sinirhodobacter populi]RWR32295.1 hypothetical protein D2T29_08870 [Sinirhodobacter populi]